MERHARPLLRASMRRSSRRSRTRTGHAARCAIPRSSRACRERWSDLVRVALSIAIAVRVVACRDAGATRAPARAVAAPTTLHTELRRTAGPAAADCGVGLDAASDAAVDRCGAELVQAHSP